jgi:short-subunit dehydrogenase involved in D-alanine esterification of teichoic acids
VESIDSINTFRDFLKQNYDGIDVLVNNAGVYIPVILINIFKLKKFILFLLNF